MAHMSVSNRPCLINPWSPYLRLGRVLCTGKRTDKKTSIASIKPSTKNDTILAYLGAARNKSRLRRRGCLFSLVVALHDHELEGPTLVAQSRS
jgi:hypothetical protein